MTHLSAALAGQSLLIVLALLITALIIVVMGAVTWSFDLRRGRLPQATAWDDLNQRLVSLAGQHTEKQAELEDIKRQISERDHIAAEIAALKRMLDDLRLELTGLDEGRRQIEEIKHKAAEAATAYAEQSGKLEELRRALAEAEERRARLTAQQDELSRLQTEMEPLRAEVSALENKLTELRVERAQLLTARSEAEDLAAKNLAARQEIERLQHRTEEAAAAAAEADRRRSDIMQRLDAIQPKLAEAERLMARLPEMEARAAALEEAIRQKLASEQERIAREVAEGQAEIGRARAELESLRVERSALETELPALREERAKVLATLNEAQEFVRKIDAMRQDVARLQREKEQAEAAAADAERRRIAVQEKLDGLQIQMAEARRLAEEISGLEARKAALEQKIGELRRDGGEGIDPLADLRLMPQCLSTLPEPGRAAEIEADAVEEVCLRLENLGLRYSRRVVRAFHTALKINESAQLTVLAGVSGTGKSLLPRRYAEAMGIAFLQIAVEPRWDSPQDLLGFYNYVERRYRATELARAMVQMDPFNTSGLAEAPLGDRMLLVLLDEMNLARVEYYFSEFLSRLEVRPPYDEAGKNEANRRDASMPIDIRGRQEGPVYLFPSHNVLFAGTMNDDESTQALSDKVLDRGNVMQFAAPRDFAPNVAADPPKLPSGYRRFKEWRSWVKAIKDLDGTDRKRTEDIVGKLARIMENFGRPFGHRLNEAILTYVANYPRRAAESVDEPLADQIEFRILPKLRGVPIRDTSAVFEQLEHLIGQDLRDGVFAKHLNGLRERQESGSGQFNWRGLDREEV